MQVVAIDKQLVSVEKSSFKFGSLTIDSAQTAEGLAQFLIPC